MSGVSLRCYDSPADRIRQHRQADPRPLLIVEGPDDELVLSAVLEGVPIFPASGRASALSVAEALIAWSVTDFFVITDPDFSTPGALSDPGRHVPYPHRDLEAMLVRLGVLALILTHQGSTDKIARADGVVSVLQKIEASVTPITRLRIENARLGLGLSFDEVDLRSKIDKNSLDLEVHKYVTALLAASRSSSTHGELLKIASDVLIPGCLDFRGKDVIEVAGVALRSKIGSLSHAAAHPEVLLGQLHSSAGLALSKSSWLSALRVSLRVGP